MIKQSAEDASIGKRGAASLPEANGGSAATGEADSKKDEPLRRKKTLKKKGKSFKLTILKKRREKIKGRLLRKSSTTEDLLLSTRNLVAVEEELAEFNDLFKMLLGRHKENNALMHDQANSIVDDWFIDLENQVYTFTRKKLCFKQKT